MELIKCNLDGRVVDLDISKVINIRDRKISLFKIATRIDSENLDSIGGSDRFSEEKLRKGEVDGL